MMLSHPPKFLQRIYASLIWQEVQTDNKIYLTFDDGPTPGVTEKVLQLLQEYKAKATFFCLGKNVANHSEIYQQIRSAGHAVGNHSYHHSNGWKTNTSDYVKEVMMASELIDSKLFRPPYGKIKSKQIKRLRKQFKIVMWSTLTGDYDPKLSQEDCLKISLKNLKPGAILVFHDSLKAADKMIYVLEKVLQDASKQGLEMAVIPS